VDERLARRTWPGQDPLKQELSVQLWTEAGFRPRWGQVIGVVHHLRHQDPAVEVREQVFVPFAQAPRNQMAVVIRSREDLESLMRTVTKRIAAVDPDLSPLQVERLDTYVSRKLAPARFSMLLGAVFAALSLLMACVGVYGVISYAVAQRRSELAVRVALGAGRRDVLRLVVLPGLTMTGIGLLLGLLGAAGTAVLMKGLLFGVTTFDPFTFIAASCCLGATAVLACWLPARGAATVDPALVLHSE
jgi:ABC-type antimicrobial peptide transport system permease subunit